jgi:competence protein ComEC
MQIFFWIALILSFIFRYFTTRPNYQIGDKVIIKSTVISEPIRYTSSQYLKLSGLKIYLPPFPEIHYGDKVVIRGIIAEEKKLENPSLIKITESENLLFMFRARIINFYQKALPQPHSSLVAGVTLGSKSSIPEHFWDELKRSGTAHVVVASGMNVSLVAAFLMNTLILFVSRKFAVAFAVLGICLYSLISGFDAPIVRATVMGSIAFLAQGLGKLYQAKRALLISATLMLIVNPNWINDLGFILSFVSTASLIFFESTISRKISKIPPLLREGLSTSLAAQVGVAPILFVVFGQFNLFSPLINALILWTIPIITIVGATGGLIGVIIPPLGKLTLLLIYPLTWWFVSVIELFS